MKPDTNIAEATNLIFSERKDFIIIGLTGRTGSGCTSIANLLSKDFEELSLSKPKECSFENNEERKYSIIYNFAQKNWHKFTIIQMSNIITSFMLLYDFENFVEFFEFNFYDIIDNYEKTKEYLQDNIKSEYNRLYNIRQDVKRKVGQNDKYLGDDNIYKFYFEEIPHFTNNFVEGLNYYDVSVSTKVYQKVGNNIRSSGEAFCDEIRPENILQLSREANKLIKILRKRNLLRKKQNNESDGKVLVVIDALRTPYEVSFFKDRYSAFYLFSINTDNETRIKRLVNKNYTKEQIEELDHQEYPAKKGIQHYYSQDLQGCIELSDVHLYNPDDSERFNELKKQLVRYITLIMHPGLVTPTHVERCMQIAYNAKLNSGCLSRQVGAVITDENYYVRSIGWNSPPEGQVPCNLRTLNNLIEFNDESAFSQYEKNDEKFMRYVQENLVLLGSDIEKLRGRPYYYCFKDLFNNIGDKKGKNQVHTRSLHAEENAFLQISKQGGASIEDGYLFTTASPCELCSKKAYHLGIKKIYYIDPYPGISNDHILNAGTKEIEMILFNGAIGRAYNQFYTQILPLKDELSMLLNYKIKDSNKKEE